MSVSAALFPPTRRRVLRLFFTQPGRRYRLQDVLERVGLGSGPVQNELRRLQAVGLLDEIRDGEQIFYQVAQDAPVFRELCGLVMKTEGVQQVLETALQPLADRIPVAFIYGPFARADDAVAGDVDVFIVGEVQVEDVARALEPAHDFLEREINPSIVTIERFRWNLQTGDPFLLRVIDGPKIFLVGDQEGLVDLGK